MRNSTPSWGLAVILVLLAALWWALLTGFSLPQPAAVDAAPARFSALRARALLHELLADEAPHPIGSPANALLRARVFQQLTELGLHPEIQSNQITCNRWGICGTPSNIVARIEGRDRGQAVLLCAHYDSVPAGPGASDDGAGVASVLEIARALTRRPQPRHSIILLIDDGEEAGLLGADAFVRHHRWAGSIKAAVNLEARGTSGPSFMFETGSANQWLMRLYGQTIERPIANSVYYAVYQKMPNATDFTIFRAAGYQGFNFAFIGDVGRYHTPLDNWINADAGSIQHQGDNGLAVLWALANAQDVDQHTAEADYFDLLGRVLVQIPAKILVPVTGFVLFVFIVLALRLTRRKYVAPAQILWGTLGLLVAILSGAVVAAVLLIALHLLHIVPPIGSFPFVATAWALQVAFSVLALPLACVSSVLLSHRAGFWGVYLSGIALNLVFALVLSLYLPGAGYLTLVPAVAAVIALSLLLGRAGDTVRKREVATGIASIVSFGLLFPIMVPLYQALGTDCLPLITVMLGIGSFSIVALLCDVGGRAVRAYFGFGMLLMLAALGAAAWLPRYSPSTPERVNLIYQVDGNRQTARWLLNADSQQLSAAFAGLAPFENVPTSAFSWSLPRSFVARAPLLNIQLPELQRLSVTRQSGRSGYHAHVISMRGAPRLLLAFPPAAAVGKVTVDGLEEVTPVLASSGWKIVMFEGTPVHGLDIAFDTVATPFDVVLVDESYGVPEQGRALQRARDGSATASQDGDVTVIQQSIHLHPPQDGSGDG